jgi:hypothetical protein
MTNFTDNSTKTFQSTGNLNANVSVASLIEATASLAVNLGIKYKVYNELLYLSKYVGEESAPQDIKRLRRQVYDMMRRMGQPVIIKKMLTIDDVNNGFAERSPNFDNIYGQTRNNDHFSWGSGFVSKEKSDDEWIDPSSGDIIKSDYASNSSWVKAPKYRGYGPSIVTYLIQPDAAQDFFTLTPTGAMIQVQTSQVTMGWFPKVNDNDLIINIELDENGFVASTTRRYQAKLTNPITIRGLDRKGRREYNGDLGNRHMVNQNYEMTLIPSNHVLMNVETDR